MKKVFFTLLLTASLNSFSQGLSKELLERQRFVESSNRQDAVSRCGAIGIAQFLPSTWSWIQEIGLIPKHYSINSKSHQIEAQRAYMEYLYKLPWIIEKDSLEATIAAYNCGRGRVLGLMRKYREDWKKYLPNETKNYLIKINE